MTIVLLCPISVNLDMNQGAGCSAGSVRSEEIRTIIREKLNCESIKLWEPPYTNSDGSEGNIPEVV